MFKQKQQANESFWGPHFTGIVSELQLENQVKTPDVEKSWELSLPVTFRFNYF